MSVVIARTVTVPAIRETLTTQLCYHFPQISDVHFANGAIIVQTADTELIQSRVERMVDEILAKFARIPANVSTKTYFDSATERDVRPYVAELPHEGAGLRAGLARFIADLRAGSPVRSWPDAVPVRTGLLVYSGAAVVVGRALDDFLRRYFETAYAAPDLRVPSMISAETVHRSGYFESGCQHLSFVTPISNDPDVFPRFLPYWRSRTAEDGQVFDYLKRPTDLLNPALCLHCYPLLADTTVPSNEHRILTVGGSCFRDEGGNLNNAERLNEFQMREGVFVGGVESLDRFHAEMMAFTVLFGSLLGFRFTLESATDIFFNENAQAQLFSQLLSTDKMELRVYTPRAGKNVAVGSINKHGTHFAKSFGIRDENDRPALTMCAAYGIDRLMLALDPGEGLDPDALADAVTARAERCGLL